MHAESGAPWRESFWYFMLCSIRLTSVGAKLPYKSEQILALGPSLLKSLLPRVTIESFIIDGEHVWYHEGVSGSALVVKEGIHVVDLKCALQL
jgi:hypothetical protein